MQRPFFAPLWLRLIALCTVFVIVPMLLFACLGLKLAEDVAYYGVTQKLKDTANILESFLPEKGFDHFVNQYGVQYRSREEKIEALNAALAPITENVASASPGIALGYYSLELNAIITYGPAEKFGHMVGHIPRADHPGLQALKELKPTIVTDTLIPGHVIDVAVPIMRQGKVIGIAWANESSANIHQQLRTFSENFIFIIFISSIVGILILVGLYLKIFHNFWHFAQGIRLMQEDTTTRLLKRHNMFDSFGKSVNTLADQMMLAEKQTHASKLLLNNVLQNTPAAILICDPSTMTLAYANPSAMNLWNLNNFEEKPCYQVLHERHAPCEACPHAELFVPNAPHNSSTKPHRIHHKELQRDFLVHDSIIPWAPGKFFHMRLATDITTYNARTMLEANTTAQHKFLARMNHELRTPIHNVLDVTRAALNNKPSYKQGMFLKKIQASAHQLLDTMHTVSDYSHLETEPVNIEEKVFDLHDFLHSLEESIYPLINNNNVSLQLIIEESVPKFMLGDSFRLCQIVMHIVDNAIRNTKKGFISIRTSTHELYNGVSHLRFVIKDSGFGIEKRDLEKIFKPHSLDESTSTQFYSNTGLGLTIVKTLVHLMGGEVEIQSTIGVGTTFTFFIELKEIPDANAIAAQKKTIKTERYT